jgi:hypothetical protein
MVPQDQKNVEMIETGQRQSERKTEKKKTILGLERIQIEEFAHFSQIIGYRCAMELS